MILSVGRAATASSSRRAGKAKAPRHDGARLAQRGAEARRSQSGRRARASRHHDAQQRIRTAGPSGGVFFTVTSLPRVMNVHAHVRNRM